MFSWLYIIYTFNVFMVINYLNFVYFHDYKPCIVNYNLEIESLCLVVLRDSFMSPKTSRGWWGRCRMHASGQDLSSQWNSDSLPAPSSPHGSKNGYRTACVGENILLKKDKALTAHPHTAGRKWRKQDMAGN